MILSMGNFSNSPIFSIGNSGNGALLSLHNTALPHKQKEVFPTFKDKDLVSADGISAGQGNQSVSGLYSREGTLSGAGPARQHTQSDNRTPVKRTLDMIAQRGYMDWEDGALSQKVSLVSQLFSSQDAEPEIPETSPVSQLFGSQDAEPEIPETSLVSQLFSSQDAEPEIPETAFLEKEKDAAAGLSAGEDRLQGIKIEPPSEKWSLKTTGEDVAAQMKKGAFLYHVDGGNMYVQGLQEDGSLDMQKMCSLDDLRGNLTEDVMDALTRDDDTKKDDGKRSNMQNHFLQKER